MCAVKDLARAAGKPVVTDDQPVGMCAVVVVGVPENVLAALACDRDFIVVDNGTGGRGPAAGGMSGGAVRVESNIHHGIIDSYMV